MADGNGGDRRRSAGDGAGVLAALREAGDQFTQLTGKLPESTSSVERTDGGWQVVFEVLELERVPSTTSVMASYEADLDNEGNLLGYRRVRRYHRSETDPA